MSAFQASFNFVSGILQNVWGILAALFIYIGIPIIIIAIIAIIFELTSRNKRDDFNE